MRRKKSNTNITYEGLKEISSNMWNAIKMNIYNTKINIYRTMQISIAFKETQTFELSPI